MSRLLPSLGLLALALLSTLCLAGPALLGWRVHVEVLTGNLADGTLALEGGLYALAWIQWVVLTPMLLGGSLLGMAWELVLMRRGA